MSISDTLAAIRKERGYYQKEVASALRVSPGTISNYESGRHLPDPTTICQFANFYQVTTDYLLGRTKYTCDLSLLDAPLTDSYTIGDLLNTTLELSPQSKKALAEYIELLKLRETVPTKSKNGATVSKKKS